MAKRQRLADLRALQYRIQDEIDALSGQLAAVECPPRFNASRLQTITPEERAEIEALLAAERRRAEGYRKMSQTRRARRQEAS